MKKSSKTAKPKAKFAKGKAKIVASNKYPIQPLFDRVLLREIKEVSGQTKSGIYIPESAHLDKETKKGEVVAVGAGKYDDGILITPTVKPGDVVVYSWGEKLSVHGIEYMLVRESEISAILNS